jgi:ParB family chromosome partitioning protein
LHVAPYGLFEDAAEHFVGDDQNHEKTDDEILADALAACPDDKLMGFLLRLIFTEHIGVPLAEQPDWLIKAGLVFVAAQPAVLKGTGKKKPTLVKQPVKQTAVKKKVAA